MSDKITIEAPIKVEIKVIVADGNGGMGEVTFELPAMQYPTRESIDEAIREIESSDVLSKNDMEIASRRETFDYIIRERTGTSMSFAMPKPTEGNWWEKQD